MRRRRRRRLARQVPARRGRRHSARDAAKSLRKAAVILARPPIPAPTPSGGAAVRRCRTREAPAARRSRPSTRPPRRSSTDLDEDRCRGALSNCATRSSTHPPRPLEARRRRAHSAHGTSASSPFGWCCLSCNRARHRRNCLASDARDGCVSASSGEGSVPCQIRPRTSRSDNARQGSGASVGTVEPRFLARSCSRSRAVNKSTKTLSAVPSSAPLSMRAKVPNAL